MANETKRRSRTPHFYLALALACAATACAPGCKRGEKRDDAPEAVRTPGVAIPFPLARAAFVTNNGSDSLGIVDRDGDTVVEATLDIVSDAHEAPHHLAVDARHGSAFVALAFPPPPLATKKKDPHGTHGRASDVGRVVRLDLARAAVTAAVDVDENPGDLVLTHDGARVLVTHFDMKRAMDVAARGGASPASMFARLLVLDARTLARVGERPLCVAPHGVVTTRDDSTAFVACYGSDELAVVDLTTPAFQAARHPLGGAPGVPGAPRYGPYSATLSPDESYVVVADLEGQDVRVFDRATKRFVPERTVTLDAKAFMPAFVSGDALIVPLQAPDGLARVDMIAHRVAVRTTLPRDACILPHAVRVAPDGRVYLVCEGDHQARGTLLEIDPATLAVKRRWTVGVLPDGLDFGDAPH